MRHLVRWFLPVLIAFAGLGCATVTPDTFSARGPAATPPAQFAEARPEAVRPTASGYPATFASTSRSAAPQFKLPQCLAPS